MDSCVRLSKSSWASGVFGLNRTFGHHRSPMHDSSTLELQFSIEPHHTCWRPNSPPWPEVIEIPNGVLPFSISLCLSVSFSSLSLSLPFFVVYLHFPYHQSVHLHWFTQGIARESHRLWGLNLDPNLELIWHNNGQTKRWEQNLVHLNSTQTVLAFSVLWIAPLALIRKRSKGNYLCGSFQGISVVKARCGCRILFSAQI